MKEREIKLDFTHNKKEKFKKNSDIAPIVRNEIK